MPFNFLNQGQSDDTATSFRPIDTFIDPVSKIRVSNPANLIDTDFEYGLQPTKWETVEIINNTPAFFSKSGDTTIPDITGVTTNAGTREITVTTAFPHNLDVGIPVRVSGTKSLTADGSYIINATPTATTFTYLARANQPDTISIFDLYTSIITGEFFQGSQISISDAEGMTTDGQGPNSTLTIKTENKHGFGPKTPFYFLNINSTVSQEFQAQNSTSLSFDPTNSATAQSFDGSNTLLQTPIDLSNSATTSIYTNSITSTDPANSTVTISIASGDEDNWSALVYGDPLYYEVSIGSGYFQSNPRGVTFIKSVAGIDVANNTATFQLSEVPDGDILPVLANMTGYFKIADQAKTFAGNNVNEQTQTELNIFVESEFVFDGGNQGYDGDPPSPPSNVATVVGYTGTSMTVFTAEGTLDYYVGAMLEYNSDGDVATGLSNATTYFVTAFSQGASAGLYSMSIAELPGQPDIDVSGGSGTQTFSKIGVSADKDVVHVRDSNFEEDDMLEYIYPNDGSPGNFGADFEKRFYFVQQALDSHNYRLSEKATFRPLVASGGDSVTEVESAGRTYKVHAFTSTTTSNFTVESLGDSDEVEYLIVAGGGGGGAGRSVTTGNWYSGAGGGAGGLLNGVANVSVGNYPVTVGAGGLGAVDNVDLAGEKGDNSTAFGLTAIGGGPGSTCRAYQQGLSSNAGDGGSGGGRDGQSYDAAGRAGRPGQGVSGQGNNGGDASENEISGGGGGAGAPGGNGTGANPGTGGAGGAGLLIQGFEQFGENGYFAGGGAGGVRTNDGNSVRPGGIGGGGNAGTSGYAAVGTSGQANTGGGGAGMGVNSSDDGGRTRAANGGSGVVLIRYPITEVPIPGITATGGTITEVEKDGIIFKTHAFTATGTDTFAITGVLRPDIAEVEYLIVAGGGGGGASQTTCTTNWYDGGGGGAGGLLNGKIGVTTNSYSVVVGTGGAGAVNNVDRFGAKGSNSSAFGLTAIGGGGGETRGSVERCGGNVTSMDGGSGGGRGDWGSHRAGRGTSGQGNDGGIGAFEQAGGGGGAGQPGQNAGTTTGGNGGNGLSIGSFSEFGEFGAFAGGGGGGARVESGNSSGSGGSGGGGNGNLNSGNNAPGFDALPNTGGGGGGMGAGTSDNGNRSTGGDGGSGVVLITYPIGAA